MTFFHLFPNHYCRIWRPSSSSRLGLLPEGVPKLDLERVVGKHFGNSDSVFGMAGIVLGKVDSLRYAVAIVYWLEQPHQGPQTMLVAGAQDDGMLPGRQPYHRSGRDPAEELDQCFDHPRVKLPVALLPKDSQRLVVRARRAVGALRCDCVVGIHYADQRRHGLQRRAIAAVGITPAVGPFMMLQNRLGDGGMHFVVLAQHQVSETGMLLDMTVFLDAETPGLVENRLVELDLAEIVKHAGQAGQLDLILLPLQRLGQPHRQDGDVDAVLGVYS